MKLLAIIAMILPLFACNKGGFKDPNLKDKKERTSYAIGADLGKLLHLESMMK